MLTVFLHHRAVAIPQPFWTGLFSSEKMQCYPTLNGGKNCLGSTPPSWLGNFGYIKTKVSPLFQLMHITVGKNNLYATDSHTKIFKTYNNFFHCYNSNHFYKLLINIRHSSIWRIGLNQSCFLSLRLKPSFPHSHKKL